MRLDDVMARGGPWPTVMRLHLADGRHLVSAVIAVTLWSSAEIGRSGILPRCTSQSSRSLAVLSALSRSRADVGALSSHWRLYLQEHENVTATPSGGGGHPEGGRPASACGPNPRKATKVAAVEREMVSGARTPANLGGEGQPESQHPEAFSLHFRVWLLCWRMGKLTLSTG